MRHLSWQIISIKSIRFNGRVVKSFEMTLKRRPHLTAMEFAKQVCQADAIDIDIMSFQEKGGGLSQIKVYRD
jgi:hypothetical protein